MAFGGPEDYWWLKPQRNNTAGGMAVGANIAQNLVQQRRQALQDELQQKQSQINAQKSMIEIKTYFDGLELKNKQMAGNAALAGAIKNVTDWTSTDSIKSIAEVGEKHPELVGTPQFTRAIGLHEEAMKAKAIKDRYTLQEEEWVPPDEATGAPGYFLDRKGGIKFPPKGTTQRPERKANWIPANPDTGMPEHFESDGRVTFKPRTLDDGTEFTPKEITMDSGTKLIQIGPKRWTVGHKPLQAGDMTPLEKSQLRELQNQLDDATGALKEPTGIAGEKLKAEMTERYNKQMIKVDEAAKKVRAFYDKVEGRSAKAPATAPAKAAPAVKAAGTKADPHRPKTPAEASEIPKGEYFLKPDGTLIQRE